MTSHIARTTVRVNLAAALILSLGACSGDDAPDAAKLTADAQKASTGAKSVAVDIVGDVNGTKTTMNVAGALDGSNQKQIQAQKSASSEGLVIAKQAYLKGNTAFWQQIGTPAATAQKLNGGWWQGQASDSASSPAVDIKKLLTDFFASDEGKKLTGKDAKVAETTTAGVDTYTVSDPKDADAPKISVKRDGDHQLVKIENYSSALTNTKAGYTFTRWNSIEKFTAPSGAKPITSVLR